MRRAHESGPCAARRPEFEVVATTHTATSCGRQCQGQGKAKLPKRRPRQQKPPVRPEHHSADDWDASPTRSVGPVRQPILSKFGAASSNRRSIARDGLAARVDGGAGAATP